MSKIIVVSTENFQKEVIESEQTVLVDFWTDGCGPCEAMVPMLEEFAKRLEGKMKIAKFHIPINEVMESSNEIAKKYEVMGFPTFIIFRNGEVLATEIGGMYENEFQKFLDRVL